MVITNVTKQKLNLELTRTVESLAARAMISAQDTVLGHSFSIADLTSSITSKPRAEFLFGLDLFSLIIFPVLSNSNDASHPCNNSNQRQKEYVTDGKEKEKRLVVFQLCLFSYQGPVYPTRKDVVHPISLSLII